MRNYLSQTFNFNLLCTKIQIVPYGICEIDAHFKYSYINFRFMSLRKNVYIFKSQSIVDILKKHENEYKACFP